MRKLDLAGARVTEEYVHGYATAEQERLLRQAEHWRDELILAGTTLAPGTRLLEVGCGVGAVLGILGTAFPGIVLAGVDIEARQLEAARAHLAELGLEADLRQANALDLPFPEASFDHVWMMWFLEHLADPVAALREARRVLVPGGTLTAIEVDYNTIWASPTSQALKALFVTVAHAMEAAARSDAGTRLPEWLVQAGFTSLDHVHVEDVAVRLAGELVGAVRSAHSNRQRVDPGFLDELHGFVRVGQQLVVRELAFRAVAVFLVAHTGLKRALLAEFAVHRDAAEMGHVG